MFWADISRWQHVVDSSYPLPILSFRVDLGGGIDENAAANWRYCRTSPKIQAAIGYVVLRPGQGAAIATRVRSFFGPPPAKLCLMLDVEGGPDFMGSGDATHEANALAEVFADWFGDHRRVIGYDNPNDSARWTHPAWLKIVTPRYGTTDPGTWAWQYYGGDPRYPSPAGYPRSCPPFGGSVDLNVCHKPLADVLTDLGLNDPPKEEDEEMFIFRDAGLPDGRKGLPVLVTPNSRTVISHPSSAAACMAAGAKQVVLPHDDYIRIRKGAVR